MLECRSPTSKPFLHDSFVIVDEAQSLERGVLRPCCRGSGELAVVLTHDVAQRDNSGGRYDGWSRRSKAQRHPLFAHITLTRSDALRLLRSSEMLEG